MIEFMHKDLYGVALDICKRFVSKELNRPILTYAFHSSNGDLLATNSQKAILIRDIHGFDENILVNPVNHMFAKGDYPDLYKVIDKERHVHSITLTKDQIKLWLQIFKSINQTLKNMKKYTQIVTLHFEEASILVEVKIDNENGFTTQIPTAEFKKPNFERIAFSPEIMKDALEAHFKLNSKKLNIYFSGKLHPIILDDEEKVKTVVLPFRCE